MTTSQETISDTARRDGEAYSRAMRNWVDNYYDVLGLMLNMQRDFVKIFLPTTLPTAKTTSGKN